MEELADQQLIQDLFSPSNRSDYSSQSLNTSQTFGGTGTFTAVGGATNEPMSSAAVFRKIKQSLLPSYDGSHQTSSSSSPHKPTVAINPWMMPPSEQEDSSALSPAVPWKPMPRPGQKSKKTEDDDESSDEEEAIDLTPEEEKYTRTLHVGALLIRVQDPPRPEKQQPSTNQSANQSNRRIGSQISSSTSSKNLDPKKKSQSNLNQHAPFAFTGPPSIFGPLAPEDEIEHNFGLICADRVPIKIDMDALRSRKLATPISVTGGASDAHAVSSKKSRSRPSSSSNMSMTADADGNATPLLAFATKPLPKLVAKPPPNPAELKRLADEAKARADAEAAFKLARSESEHQVSLFFHLLDHSNLLSNEIKYYKLSSAWFVDTL
jgi:hypothetical protein